MWNDCLHLKFVHQPASHIAVSASCIQSSVGSAHQASFPVVRDHRHLKGTRYCFVQRRWLKPCIIPDDPIGEKCHAREPVSPSTTPPNVRNFVCMQHWLCFLSLSWVRHTPTKLSTVWCKIRPVSHDSHCGIERIKRYAGREEVHRGENHENYAMMQWFDAFPVPSR